MGSIFCTIIKSSGLSPGEGVGGGTSDKDFFRNPGNEPLDHRRAANNDHHVTTCAVYARIGRGDANTITMD